jgi:hypothetical protein
MALLRDAASVSDCPKDPHVFSREPPNLKPRSRAGLTGPRGPRTLGADAHDDGVLSGYTVMLTSLVWRFFASNRIASFNELRLKRLGVRPPRSHLGRSVHGTRLITATHSNLICPYMTQPHTPKQQSTRPASACRAFVPIQHLPVLKCSRRMWQNAPCRQRFAARHVILPEPG